MQSLELTINSAFYNSTIYVIKIQSEKLEKRFNSYFCHKVFSVLSFSILAKKVFLPENLPFYIDLQKKRIFVLVSAGFNEKVWSKKLGSLTFSCEKCPQLIFSALYQKKVFHIARLTPNATEKMREKLLLSFIAHNVAEHLGLVISKEFCLIGLPKEKRAEFLRLFLYQIGTQLKVYVKENDLQTKERRNARSGVVFPNLTKCVTEDVLINERKKECLAFYWKQKYGLEINNFSEAFQEVRFWVFDQAGTKRSFTLSESLTYPKELILSRDFREIEKEKYTRFNEIKACLMKINIFNKNSVLLSKIEKTIINRNKENSYKIETKFVSK